MQTILAKSLNTGAVFVEQKMGNDTFRKYMLSFVLVRNRGLICRGCKWFGKKIYQAQRHKYATASFGQGIALSPIQVVRALSAQRTGSTHSSSCG